MIESAAKNTCYITAWLATRPLPNPATDKINAIVDDLRRSFAKYSLTSIRTSEPRMYRMTPLGRTAFNSAISSNRIDWLAISSTSVDVPAGFAMVHIFLGDPEDSSSVGSIMIEVRPLTERAVLETASEASLLIQRWFALYDGIAAFISSTDIRDLYRVGDDPQSTMYEQTSYLAAPTTIQEISRFARGAFWGNGLGDELCRWLGGKERILRDAPVFCCKSLTNGVWIQATESFPPNKSVIDHLLQFLSPILRRNSDNLINTSIDGDTFADSSTSHLNNIIMDKHGVVIPPVRWVQGFSGRDIGINIHLDSPPTPNQRRAIEGVINRWYEDGFRGGYAGIGFHDRTPFSVHEAAIRFQIDLGSANAIRAFDSLRARLAALEDPHITEIVLGTEEIG